MTTQKKEWCYFDEQTGQWSPLMTLAELDEQHNAGKIEDFTSVISRGLARAGPMAQGIPYSTIARLEVDFVPSVEHFHSARAGKPITVLAGPNNCGKTLLLKHLFSVIGHDGYLIACSRFSHVDFLNTRQQEEHGHRRYFENFILNFQTAQQNTENNELNLEQIITGLKNTQRDRLFNTCKDLLGNEFSLKRTDPENTFSPFYVDMDGENLRYGSSGTRLLLTMLGILLDDRFSVILIDEPELGLSPGIQAVLADLMYDEERRLEFCPHLRQLYIATHSHLLLDRRVFSNNHVVTKSSSLVSIDPVQSVGEFHHLQFNMLGNSLESMFLPSAIMIVEGASDVTFLTKVTQLHIRDYRVAIVRADGDGEVQSKLNVLKDAFGDLAASPYKDRLFVVLDKKHSVSARRIENQGVSKRNIIVWSENGIEYLYPPELTARAFRCDPVELQGCSFENDPIEFNGIRKSKKELAQFVAEAMTVTQPLHGEVSALVNLIGEACR